MLTGDLKCLETNPAPYGVMTIIEDVSGDVQDYIQHACCYKLSYSLLNTSLASHITISLSNRECLGYDGKATASTRESSFPGSTIGANLSRNTTRDLQGALSLHSTSCGSLLQG
ncbi:hypothetical protein TNCV_898291 [Trichonephila clavipes]|nr:hypothetical protein TNCV_898291 [Trichonephila clavipes]